MNLSGAQISNLLPGLPARFAPYVNGFAAYMLNEPELSNLVAASVLETDLPMTLEQGDGSTSLEQVFGIATFTICIPKIIGVFDFCWDVTTEGIKFKGKIIILPGGPEDNGIDLSHADVDTIDTIPFSSGTIIPVAEVVDVTQEPQDCGLFNWKCY